MEDPEIAATSLVASALAPLSEDEVGRVLRWTMDEHGLAVIPQNVSNAPGVKKNDDGALDDETGRYEYFAEFFSKASPKTDVHKAFVAAYWLHVHNGMTSWQSRALNAELKNLGHSLSNVTTSLSSSMNRKHQLIIQLTKSGSAKQSNKTYTLTAAGISTVEKMLRGELK